MKDSTIQSLKGKTCLLTGASSGLGHSLAIHLAVAGVGKLILSARRRDALETVEQECQQVSHVCKTTTDFQIVLCDLADPNSVQALCESIKTQRVDVLINNGGMSSRSRFLETAIQVDSQLMQVNFLAGAALAKAVVPGMIQQQSGRIIWISSVQGKLGIPNRTSYAASKFAVQGYCESLRAELQSSGVQVHIVSPGYINTNLSQSAIMGDGSAYGKTDATTAQGANPSEVAKEILDRVVSNNEVDFLVAAGWSARIGILLRFLWPSFLQSSLVKRYEKSLKEKDE